MNSKARGTSSSNYNGRPGGQGNAGGIRGSSGIKNPMMGGNKYDPSARNNYSMFNKARD